MRINFLLRHDLLTKWTLVPLKACQQFAQWFNGDDAMRLDTPFAPHLSRKVVSLDCNAAGNIGLVRRFKVQLRIIDQLVLNVLKNHITVLSYKSFLAHKVDFSFIEEKTGQPLYSGLILLRKMMDVCKPETIVEVSHLKQQLDTITLWPGHKNNVRLLTTKMMTILQEIHAKLVPRPTLTSVSSRTSSVPSAPHQLRSFKPSSIPSRATGSWRKSPIRLK